MNDQSKKTEDAQIQKENEDLPNIPAATGKIEEVQEVKEEIDHTSDLQQDGKTDNTERNSEN